MLPVHLFLFLLFTFSTTYLILFKSRFQDETFAAAHAQLILYSDKVCQNLTAIIQYQLNTCVKNGEPSVNAPFVTLSVVNASLSNGAAKVVLNYYSDSSCTKKVIATPHAQRILLQDQCFRLSTQHSARVSLIPTVPLGPFGFHGLGLFLHTSSAKCRSDAIPPVANYRLILNQCIPRFRNHSDVLITSCDGDGFEGFYYSSMDGTCEGKRESLHHTTSEACTNGNSTVDYVMEGYVNYHCYSLYHPPLPPLLF
jgi:hypothetical protein